MDWALTTQTSVCLCVCVCMAAQFVTDDNIKSANCSRCTDRGVSWSGVTAGSAALVQIKSTLMSLICLSCPSHHSHPHPGAHSTVQPIPLPCPTPVRYIEPIPKLSQFQIPYSDGHSKRFPVSRMSSLTLAINFVLN